VIVYKTTNLLNGKVYIGQDSKNRHTYLGSGILLKKAIKKYGRDNFVKDTVAWCDTKDKLDFLEKFYIDFFKTRVPNGYNLTDGGEGIVGHHHAEETKQKMSKAALGKPKTEEAKSRMSQSKKGSYHSEETKQKMSQSHQGHPNYCTEDGIRKMSESLKGHGTTIETKQKISESLKQKVNAGGRFEKGHIPWQKIKSVR